ncbi:AfsR/SARP family transcriptional regulator [Actinoallomurus rhizosphaericola]|uniref:AfsR/SARP family transcriptional regulator n=1 Tax=Actinoallomurus rhizosphaericola TaxID=2952536 RepID=UPI00273A5CE9|nr:tetratricopeptide repeat protein [Actinoallomurus rhizosphaericola]
MSCDVLAARLWGDDPPGKARGNLSSYISRTRGRLRDAGSDAQITSNAQTYTLTTDPDSVDLHRFRRLGRQADAIADSGDATAAVGLLLQADELWRGEPLAGLPGEWTPALRRSLEEEHRRARLKRIELELGLGRHIEIIGELHRLVAMYPLDERFTAQLMLALYRSDRQADALAVYRRIQRRLMETQGADPGAPLQRLQHQILARDGELAITPRHRSPGHGPQPKTLPPRTVHFTGRTRELRALTGTDQRGTGIQAVVIEGMPGVGKTTLAVHAAHILADRHPDAQLLLPLRAHDPHHPRLDPAGALAELLTMLGVPAGSVPPTPARRAAMWQAEMAGRRAIIVLDDAADGDQVRPLIPAARDCFTIITARNRLKNLDGLRQICLETLSPDESLVLFNRLADTGDGVDEETATRIVNLCGHLPLAIHLVASQIGSGAGSRPPEVIDDLQTAGSTVLDVGVGGDAVQAAFESSYQRLSPDQRRVFRRLGIDPCIDITTHAAAALCGTTPSDIAPVIDGLVESHLLTRGPAERLSFHDLIRGYACDRAEREDSSQERRRALGRLLDYYLRSAQRADRLLHPHRRRTVTASSRPAEDVPAVNTREDAHAWMEAEWRNSLRVIDYAIDHEWKTQGVRLAHAMAAFLDTAGQWGQAATIHERALRAARELGDARHLAQASAELSLDRLRTGRLRDALEHAQRALDAYRELRDPQAEAESLDHIGVIHWSSGRNREALAYGQEALALYRRIGDDRGQADSLAHCGIARWHLGRCEEAMDCLRQALALYRRVGDRRGEAKTLNNMGEALQQRGFHREATSLYQESLAIFSQISGRQNSAILKNNLANVLQYKGRYRPAIDAYREALVVFRETGDRKNIADVLNNIGTTYQMMDRYDEALIHHKKARAIAEEIADSYERTWAIRGMGDAYRGIGRYQDALDCYREALATAREMGDLYQEARIHDGVATVTLHLHGSQAAKIRWRQALDLFQALAVPEARSLALRLTALDGMAS